LLKLPKL